MTQTNRRTTQEEAFTTQWSALADQVLNQSQVGPALAWHWTLCCGKTKSGTAVAWNPNHNTDSS